MPDRLRIRGIEVDAPVVAATSAARTLAPPQDPRRVGWWLASAPPGSGNGTTVIVGHIDSATTGPGALFHLDQVRAGQMIELTGTRNTVTYRAVSLQFYPKTTGLPAALFASSGPSRLVIISCGGTFDAAKRSYRDNVVVTAVPIG